jgi:predicted phage baseplate assembly protein
MSDALTLCLLPPEPSEGCCALPAPLPAVPLRPYNPPGLAAIQYRIGTFTGFRRAMLNAVARPDLMGDQPNPFAAWKEGADSDYQTMFVELWAYVADVLTFYQERIANEAYLPTATQRDSLRRLGKLILYRPAPGAGATALVAFTVEKGKAVSMPGRFRVGSRAAAGKSPAVFETEQALAARSEHSSIPIATTGPQDQFGPSSGMRTVLLQGVRNRLAVGDQVLLVENEGAAGETAHLLPLSGVNMDQAGGTTAITWAETPGTSYTQAALYALRVTAAPFGNNASPWDTLPPTLTNRDGRNPGAPYPDDWDDSTQDLFYLPAPGDPENVLSLDHVEDGVSLLPGRASWAILTTDSVPPSLRTDPPPVVASNADGRLEVFAAGRDGALWHIWQVITGAGIVWSDWASLGGILNSRSRIAAGRNQDGRLEAFVLGQDGAIWHNWQLFTPAGIGWSGWASMGMSGLTTPGAPNVGLQPMLQAASNADGRLELFTLGTDNALWHIWQVAPNDGWSSWASLGGVLPVGSSLTAGRNQDGRLEVFGIGMDGAVWHNAQLTAGGWSGWLSLGKPTPGLQMQAPLSVSHNADGRLELFTLGTDNALWHIWQVQPNDGWSGWASLDRPGPGFATGTGLHIGINADGRMEPFVAGQDGALWHIWQTAPSDGWSGWDSFPGVRPHRDAITVGSNSDGRLETLTLDATGDLHTLWQILPNNGWSDGASLGSPTLPTPTRIWASRLTDARPASKAAYALSSRATRMTFAQTPIPPHAFPLRNTVVLGGNDPLALQNDLPLSDPLQGQTLTLLGQYPQLKAGQTVVVQGGLYAPGAVSAPQQGAEAVVIDQPPVIDTAANRTTLTLKSPLVNAYLHAGAVVLANVVTATQGETVKDEILGSGNGGAFQTFPLKKTPLTYLPATDTEGLSAVQSTLTVTVNGAAWTERADLLESAPDAQDYLTEQDDTGQTSVIFGDGFFGARPPTGRDNIHARYRKGLGVSGNAAAGDIRQLLDNLPGLQRVTNPQPAFGGVDAEGADQIRQNAPARLLTFGRAVSAADYAALARSYPGVAKASAAWITQQEIPDAVTGNVTLHTLPQPFLQLTVVTANRTPLAEQPVFRDRLRAFLDARRDPNVPLHIADAAPVFLEVAATVDVDDRFGRQATLAKAQAAMNPAQNPDGSFGYFAFERLDFGQSVHLSAVYAALQKVEGVRDALVTTLRRAGTTDAPGDVLLRSTEIALIENDPAHPETGHLNITLGAGGFEDS